MQLRSVVISKRMRPEPAFVDDIDSTSNDVQYISAVNRFWEPLVYPLFFPHGTLGWGRASAAAPGPNRDDDDSAPIPAHIVDEFNRRWAEDDSDGERRIGPTFHPIRTSPNGSVAEVTYMMQHLNTYPSTYGRGSERQMPVYREDRGKPVPTFVPDLPQMPVSAFDWTSDEDEEERKVERGKKTESKKGRKSVDSTGEGRERGYRRDTRKQEKSDKARRPLAPRVIS